MISDIHLCDGQEVLEEIQVLCAERVTQMTKTYNDIEAVTRLLEEKERDLELAARIGQTLLSKNKELASRGDSLDEQIGFANDKIAQLKHDLSMKDELLKFYCQDLQEQSPGDYCPGDGATNLSKVNIEMLQRKVGTLEEENIHLRLESAQLHADTDCLEEKEKKLVEDCLQQLAEVNGQVETFAEELKHKTEESSRLKEEMTGLLAQLADLHKRVRQLTIENMDLTEKLQASQESQKRLTKELSDQHDRYDELFEMLEEAQDELRGHRNRGNPKATRHLYASSHFGSTCGMDSLASELESSLHNQECEDQDKKDRRARSWKIFETARAARKAASKSSRDSSVRMSVSTCSIQDPNSQMPSTVNSDNDSFSDGYSADMDSMYGSSSELGRPGIPGSNDLESALRRLAIRRANDLNERDFNISQTEMRDDALGAYKMGDTPDSVSSPPSGYSYLGSSNIHPSPTFKLPDKLQIVKPMEGSVTLRHWQRLAQPHLGGLFERREGVKVRGERKLDLDGEVYTLSDFEEDEDLLECPSRRMADSSTIYTFTDSTVSRPSQFNSPRPSGSSASLQSLGTSTPQWQQSGVTGIPSKGSSGSTNTSSTYTMSLGLAAILQGREGSSVTRSLMRPVASCPIIPAESVARVAGGASAESCERGEMGMGMGSFPPNTPGLFGKLISTGYSLLWNKSNAPVSSPSPSPSPSPIASREASPTDSAKPTQRKPSAEQILPKGGSTGVLGAIATFRKNGIL
ncbi:trafficking kinesin-binding protein 1-like isoform X2 [Littorina saxatilis]|uniref:trafficking kinesin-binding protein 1-like isoform X2 n=1 Tax=Littorina saxatilis TaxID=31220 RepID=UPI0038B4B34F